jgi:hypothetical protein
MAAEMQQLRISRSFSFLTTRGRCGQTSRNGDEYISAEYRVRAVCGGQQ